MLARDGGEQKTNAARCVVVFFSLFLTRAGHGAARFPTRSSDYHYICFSIVLPTHNMQSYVEFLFFVIIFISST